jgi:hypothetical protein
MRLRCALKGEKVLERNGKEMLGEHVVVGEDVRLLFHQNAKTCSSKVARSN